MVAGALLVALFVVVLHDYYSQPSYYTEPDDPGFRRMLNGFLASQPTAVNISPDGKYLLAKSEQSGGFKVSVLDQNSKEEVFSTFSDCPQLALTWRPDSKAIVFQEMSGMKRPLYLLDFQSAQKKRLSGPVSQTALPPLRWNPAGTRLAYFDGDWQSGRLLVIAPQEETPPVVVQEKISANCDFAWSPDGRCLAVVTESEPGTVTLTTLEDLKQVQFQVSHGEDRNLAWSPDGASILTAAREPDDEYFKLIGIEVRTGKTSLKAQALGDISQPLWMPDGRSFIYQVNSNGITRAFIGRTDSPDAKPLGPTNGVLTVTHTSSDGKTAYAHFSSLTTPPVLGRISLENGDWKLLYACPKAEQCRCPAPGFITIKSADGTRLPAYHWAAKRGPGVKPFALIVAHGGLHTQTFPTWESYIRPMTDLGCEIIAVNHRGSTGIGRQYEQLEGDSVPDIIAARDYAANVLNIEPDRIFLTGISTGSRLVAAAAGYGIEIGGLILVSWRGSGADFDRHFARPFPILEFHGEIDAVLSPKEARHSLEKFFAGNGQGSFNIQYVVFKNEGHFFYRANSRAAIYWEFSKLIQGR